MAKLLGLLHAKARERRFVYLNAQPGPSGQGDLAVRDAIGRRTMSSARYMLVRLTPQATLGTAQARCTAAAVPMLDSAILAATLILRPSFLHSFPAANASRKPPSLISFSETPFAPARSGCLDVGERSGCSRPFRSAF
jgi:hypothetical protein